MKQIKKILDDFLKNKNVNVIFLEGTDFKICDILKKVGEIGIDAVLLEGGSFLISRAFAENAIDGGEIFIAPKILGDGEAIPFIKGFNCENISDGFQLENVKINNYGNNVSMEFYR